MQTLKRLGEAQLNQREKSLDRNELDMKRKIEDQINSLQRYENSEMKRQLANEYEQKIVQAQLQSKVDRENEKLTEQEKIRRIMAQKDLEEEHKKQLRQQFARAQNDLLSYRDWLKQKAKTDTQMAREEYNMMCQLRANQEIQRERDYKQFFKDYDQNLTSRQNMHLDQVVSKELRKQEELDTWQRNSEDAYLKELDRKEVSDKNRKLQDNESMVNTLGMQLEHKRFLQRVEQQEKGNELKQRFEDAEQYRAHVDRQKNEAQMQKHLYNDTLGQQVNVQRERKNNYGTMTMQEKKMNKTELKVNLTLMWSLTFSSMFLIYLELQKERHGHSGNDSWDLSFELCRVFAYFEKSTSASYGSFEFNREFPRSTLRFNRPPSND